MGLAVAKQLEEEADVKQLFVSYSRANKAAVDELVRRFPRLGYQGWVDSELHGGQSWWEVILGQIADCDAFVAVVSRDSLNSEACQKELKWALDLGKPVLPVAVEKAEHLVQALPRELATLQIVDWTEPSPDAAIELAGALMNLPPAPTPPEVLPQRPEAPLSYLTELGEQVSRPSGCLPHEQQRQIVIQLQRGLHSVDPEERQGALYLLDRFSRRDDLNAEVDKTLSPLVNATLPGSSSPPVLVATASVGKEPSGVAVDPVTHTVYVANRSDSTVSVIDGSTHAVTATVPLDTRGGGAMRRFFRTPPSPTGIAVDPNTRALYVANAGDSTLAVIDESTHDIIATVPVGVGPVSYTAGFLSLKVAVDSGTHTVYVTHNGRKTVSVIDGSTHGAIATVTVAEDPDDVAVNPDTHTAYVVSSSPLIREDTVSVIDGTTHAVIATLPVGKSRHHSVAVDAETNTIYVTNGEENTVSVIDGLTHNVTAAIPVGKPAGGVAVDAGLRTVYVAHPSDATLSIIDGSTHTVTANVPVGKVPDEIMVDPGTHAVYVTNLYGGTVSVLQRR